MVTSSRHSTAPVCLPTAWRRLDCLRRLRWRVVVPCNKLKSASRVQGAHLLLHCSILAVLDCCFQSIHLVIGLLQSLLGGGHLVGLLVHLVLQLCIPAPHCLLNWSSPALALLCPCQARSCASQALVYAYAPAVLPLRMGVVVHFSKAMQWSLANLVPVAPHPAVPVVCTAGAMDWAVPLHASSAAVSLASLVW